MINPFGKDSRPLFEPGHPAYKDPAWHQVDDLPSFDEIAAGGTPSKTWGFTEKAWGYDPVKVKAAKTFIKAHKANPDYEPELAGDPSREWIRQLAKTDPDRCRAILEPINTLPQAEQQQALHTAYVKFYYFEREEAVS